MHLKSCSVKLSWWALDEERIDGVVRCPQSNILHDLLSCVHFVKSMLG